MDEFDLRRMNEFCTGIDRSVVMVHRLIYRDGCSFPRSSLHYFLGLHSLKASEKDLSSAATTESSLPCRSSNTLSPSPPTMPIGTMLTLPCAHMKGKAPSASFAISSSHSLLLSTSLNIIADLQALELTMSSSAFGQEPMRPIQPCSQGGASERTAGSVFPESTRDQISERSRSMSNFGKSLHRSAIAGGRARVERV